MSRRYQEVEVSLATSGPADDPVRPEGAGEGGAHAGPLVRAAPNPARLAVMRKLGGLFRGSGGGNRAGGGQIELPFDPPLQRGCPASPWPDHRRGV